MKKRITMHLLTATIILLISAITRTSFSQSSSGPVKLEYKYPADKAVKYLNNTTMAQIIEVEGQTMQTDVNSAFGCTLKFTGNQDGNLKIEITIDTLGQTTNSPMGGAGGPIQSVKGKVCNVIISPLGKPVDITEAGKITYYVDGSGESNMSQSISDFFRLLPDKPVKVGDTWELTDSVTSTTPTMTMNVVDVSSNKLEGFEDIEGVECAKISGTHSGTWSMSIQSQGMDIFIKGPYTGTSECLFSVKDGYFLRNTSSNKMIGNLDIASMGMSMPITIDMKAINEVVK